MKPSTHSRSSAFKLPVIITAMLATTLLYACEEVDPLAPPDLRLGEDECAVCRMIISDDRYAAGVVVLDDRERHHTHGFDDIGCMFEYETSNPDAQILARYVKDRSSRQWIDAASAEFVHSRELPTPMAFGLGAAATMDDARAIQAEYGGDFLKLDEARRRFRAGTLHVGSLDDASATPVLLEREKTLQLSDGRTLHLTLHTPQMLATGQHDFELAVYGTLNDEQLRIEPEMPSMGHGSPDNEHPVQTSNDMYQGVVNFTMAGPWLVHVTVQKDDREIGRTSFAFEVTP